MTDHVHSHFLHHIIPVTDGSVPCVVWNVAKRKQYCVDFTV